MRKIIGLIISLVIMAALLISCAPKPVAPVAVVDPLAGKTFYWLAANNSNAFYLPGLAGWNDAAKDLGVKVEFVGPMDPNLAEQMKILEQLIANPNTAGILMYAMDFNAAEPLVKEAVAKGIPFVNGNNDSPYKVRNGFIGTSSEQMGVSAAEIAAKAIQCKGSVGTMGGVGVSAPPRSNAFNKHIVELCPDVKIIESGVYDGSTTDAMRIMDAYLLANPDMSLLWFVDGAAGEVTQSWKEHQQAGTKTLFLGTDMQPNALAAVKDGSWIASMGQDTYSEEYWGLQMLVAKARGRSIPDTVFPAALIVTKDNVDKYIVK